MHAYIYEISSTPINEDDRYSNTDLPDWFHGAIADGTYDTDAEERDLAIDAIIHVFGENCTYVDGELRFTGDVRERYFRSSFSEFHAAAATLFAADYRVFSGQERSVEFTSAMNTLKQAYEEKFDHYIYDKDADELIPMDAWVRDVDLTQPVFFGGVIDYHW